MIIFQKKESLNVRGNLAYWGQRSRWILVAMLVFAATLVVAAVTPSSAAAYLRYQQVRAQQTNLRMGAYLLAVARVAEAMEMRGKYL